MATLATGGVGQPGLVERRHLDQVNQLDALYQQLGDPIAAMHDDRRRRIKVDQGDLDLTAVAGIDGARAVNYRKPCPRS